MAGSVATTSNGTTGFMGPTFTAGNGTAYGYSFYGSFPSGSVFRAGMGDSNGVNLITGSFVGTGGGTWHRYAGSWTEAAGAARRLTIRKEADTNAYGFYVDAMQYEAGSVTTYIDGDQGGGYLWDSAPHNSVSVRLSSVRTGGSVVDLSTLGCIVEEHTGVGLPDLTTVFQDYAFIDGAAYQRTRANARSFLLTGLFLGTTFSGLHGVRQRVINTIKPDLMSTPQPFRLLYTGGLGSVQIDCVYDSGLQLNSPNGFSEEAAMRCIAPDPYWQSITESGTTLSPLVNLGSTNYLAARSAIGQWGTLGVAGTTVVATASGQEIRALAYNQGTLYLAGGFGTVGGTSYPSVAFYLPSNNTFGTFVGGTIAVAAADAVRDMAIDPVGTIYVGGVFASASGSTAGRGIARYTSGSWLPLSGGTIHSTGFTGVLYLLAYGGTMFLSGAFTTVNGTTLDGAVMYNTLSGSWGSMTIPASGGPIVAGKTGTIYIGTHAWNSPTVFTQMNINTGALRGMGVDAAGIVYFSQTGGSAYGGGTIYGVAGWNGQGFFALGSGLLAGANVGYARRIVQMRDGRMFMSGSFNTVNGQTWFPKGLAYWTGAAGNGGGNWVPGDIDFQTGAVLDAVVLPDGAIYAGGTFSGTATAAVVTTLIAPLNGADNYPEFTLRAPVSGTARIYQLLNIVPNDALYFDLVLQPSEVAVLSLAPGALSFTSSLRGNLVGAVLPGSNLARWRLKAGTNYVSFFSDNASLRTDLVYRPRWWSVDGGA